MVTRKKSPAKPTGRSSRGRRRQEASFPAAPSPTGLPDGYAAVLGEINERIKTERLRIVMAANSAMVLLHWDFGRMILERQEAEGRGARIIDRLDIYRIAWSDPKGKRL